MNVFEIFIVIYYGRISLICYFYTIIRHIQRKMAMKGKTKGVYTE